MTYAELEKQKQLIKVFEKLKQEIPLLSSKVTKLGWGQRNALVSHVYSNYSKHKELMEARNKWDKANVEMNVHQWLHDLMIKHRDLCGYFENYDEMKKEIDTISSAAIKKEEYQIASILTKWINELP